MAPVIATIIDGAARIRSLALTQMSHPEVPVRYNTVMSQSASAVVRSPAEIVQNSPVSQAPNGICYARSGEITIADNDLERMIAAVPVPVAASLSRKAYYFVPLTVSQGDETVIADRYDVGLSDNAVCHRNLNLGDAQCVFISTRLMDDKFSVAFEFYINVGHAQVRNGSRSRRGEVQERISFRKFCGRDFDLSAVALSGCGLPRSAGA